MNLQLLPIDQETGEVFNFEPEMVKKLDNSNLTNLLAMAKTADKIKKEAEKEVKKRLDEGQSFARLSFGKKQYTRVLAVDSKVKAALVKKYGWDSVEPLTINQLEKKFGEEIYKDLGPYIVEKPKSPAIKWDV